MMASSDPVAALDALFLYLESPRTPMHAGAVAIFEGACFKDDDGVLRIDAVRHVIERRLDLVPKLRRRVKFPRGGRSAPVWVDDVRFSIEHHVRHAALPAPGTEADLLELSAEILAAPLAREHPLWELWFVEGLQGGRVALVEKIHHALADGLASVELATVLFDFERHPGAPAVAVPLWHPRPEPKDAAVVGRELVRLGLEPTRAGFSVVRALAHPVRSSQRSARLARAIGTLATPSTVASRSSINVAVGQGRRVAFVRQPLHSLQDVERRYGATVNDILLAAVSGGLRTLLAGRGESVDGLTLQAMVPVGTDAHGDHRLGNKVSAMIVRLPVGTGDPVERLAAVAKTTRRCKERRQALVGDWLTRALEPWPRSALAGAALLIHHQPFVNLVVTNVPGPSVPLYSMGSRMLEAFPIVPLAGNLSVGVAAFSYDGQLTVGILADRDLCQDVDVLADGIRASFTELVARARASREHGDADPTGSTTRQSRQGATARRRRGSSTAARSVVRDGDVAHQDAARLDIDRRVAT